MRYTSTRVPTSDTLTWNAAVHAAAASTVQEGPEGVSKGVHAKTGPRRGDADATAAPLKSLPYTHSG